MDAIASDHLTKIGPRDETPAELAQRIVRDRATYAWFVDAPARFSAETPLSDRDIVALYEARARCGALIDHIDSRTRSSADLPDANTFASCHDDLIALALHNADAEQGPARSLKVTSGNASEAQELSQALVALSQVREACAATAWVEPFRTSAINGRSDPWLERLREHVAEWQAIAEERGMLLRRSVDIPDGLLDDEDAVEAIKRGSTGQRLWPRIMLGKAASKALVGRVRLDGGVPKDVDQDAWRHVTAVLANLGRQRETKARWDSFAREIGAPGGEYSKAAVEFAAYVLSVCDEARKQRIVLGPIVNNAFFIEGLAEQPELCQALAAQLSAAANAARLATAEELRQRTLLAFEGDDRTSVLARQLISDALGNSNVDSDRIAAAWNGVLRRLDQLKALSRDFEAIERITGAIAEAGAPNWANRLRSEVAATDGVIATNGWRDAWDHAASDALLERIDARQRLTSFAKERDAAEKQCRRLFGEIVRERTFYALERRLSPAIKAALVEFVRALTRIGRGTGKTAWTHRKTARDAMARCYNAVPCWIMPSWRVAEQLPAEVGVLDLVIIDEASQSDITELPALLRGKKILVVGDDRQVSPTAPFVTQEKIGQLRHHYLGDVPFKSLLEPGESIYDLMRAVFPNQRLMLKEHFRCVEPIIRFSMQFYPEQMLPLRIPSAQERLDPPLIDIYVPHGARGRGKKINSAEADVI